VRDDVIFVAECSEKYDPLLIFKMKDVSVTKQFSAKNVKALLSPTFFTCLEQRVEILSDW
jgi:hypothetical protein